MRNSRCYLWWSPVRRIVCRVSMERGVFGVGKVDDGRRRKGIWKFMLKFNRGRLVGSICLGASGAKVE